jgi:hypothetical protein
MKQTMLPCAYSHIKDECELFLHDIRCRGMKNYEIKDLLLGMAQSIEKSMYEDSFSVVETTNIPLKKGM